MLHTAVISLCQRKKCIRIFSLLLTAHWVDAYSARALHPEADRDVDVDGDGDGPVEGVACDAGGQARAQISVVYHLPGVQQLCGLLRTW